MDVEAALRQQLNEIEGRLKPKALPVGSAVVYSRYRPDGHKRSSSKDETAEYFFDPIANSNEVNALLEVLNRNANKQESFDYERWLNNGLKHQDAVALVSIRRHGDNEPAGFLGWKSKLSLVPYYPLDKCLSLAESEVALSWEVGVAAIYLSPNKRGVGYGTASKQFCVDHFTQVLVGLDGIEPSDLEKLDCLDLSIGFVGHADSEEGARLCLDLLEHLQGRFDDYVSEHEPWFPHDEIENDFDEREFQAGRFGY